MARGRIPTLNTTTQIDLEFGGSVRVKRLSDGQIMELVGKSTAPHVGVSETLVSANLAKASIVDCDGVTFEEGASIEFKQVVDPVLGRRCGDDLFAALSSSDIESVVRAAAPTYFDKEDQEGK